MAGRLLPREGGVVNTYLTKEIQSAKNEIGTTNTKGYSTRTWNAYAEALTKAESVVNSTSQDVIFDAKYQLQVARNNLMLAANEADYTELQELMTQAEYVFKNINLYANTDPADFGKVLAAWGYTTDSGVDLFPNSAINVFARAYDKHDQDEVDDAANELKKALSKLVFKNINYGGETVTPTDVPTGEFDENDNPDRKSTRLNSSH